MAGPSRAPSPCEVSEPPAPGELSVATFNVENLAPSDPPAKFATLADLIVNNLGAPDLVALEEIQDNNGTTNDTTVDASATYAALIAAIQAEAGVTYQVPADRSGRRPGRRCPRRQHPSGLPVPHGPRVELRRPGRWHVDHAGRRDRRSERARAHGEPRPHRACERSVRIEPQAARRRVHVQRPEALRRAATTSTRRVATSRSSGASSRPHSSPRRSASSRRRWWPTSSVTSTPSTRVPT